MPGKRTTPPSWQALLCFLWGIAASIHTLYSQPILGLTPVINSGLNSPIQFVNAGDGSKRIFIVQQGGTIRAYDATYNFLGVFLTVTGINFSGEQGLLSMVFHPNYSTNGFFYVYYVNSSGNLELARYHISADPNVADPASRVVMLTIPHPTNTNHNGGELHFGADGFLYLSTGDGGGAGDVPNNAQNSAVLLGKILRFAVNESAVAPYYSIPPGNPFGNEVFDLGLRNPFRWSFDALTQDIWIGDVGQDSFEELDFRAAGSAAGTNFGWHCYEGNNPFNTSGCGPASDYIFPVYTYPTQNPAAAITGGIVYRGNAYPALYGYQVSADFYSGNFYLTKDNGAGAYTTTVEALSPSGMADFGETEDREAFAVSLTGNAVYQVTVTGALPLVLTAFTARAVTDGVVLNWNTSREEGVDHFVVEFSENGQAFTNAGTVPARNLSSAAAYSFLHQPMTGGSLLYRLKMIDMDGSYSYSAVVAVKIDLRQPMITPTLVSQGQIRVVLGSGSYEMLELMDVRGRLALRRSLLGQTGNLDINVSSLPAGTYIVRLSSKSGLYCRKIVIP